MDKIFDNKLIQSLRKWGQKVSANKFVTSLTQGLMGTMGLIMVGAIAQILTVVLGPSILKVITVESPLYQFLYAPYTMTMNAIALWESFFIAYHYGRSLKLKPLNTGITSIVVFAMITGQATGITQVGTLGDTFYLSTGMFGGAGLFTAIIVSYTTVRMAWLCKKYHIYVKMPDIVPESLQEGFESIVPLTLSIYLWWGLSTLCIKFTGVDLSTIIIGLLGAPLGVLTSIPGCAVLLLITLILWLFGIHGTMVVLSVTLAPLMMAYTANATAVAAAGGDIHVLNYANNFSPLIAFLGASSCIGGTGDTFGLLIDALLFGKSEQARSVAKAAIIPGLFIINEPATFGFPIMYNPVLGIPYILTPMVVYFLMILGYKTGFLQIPFNLTLSVMPMGVGEFIGSMSWKNALFTYLMIPVSMLIYYPFFRIYDREKLEEEKQQKEKK